jgi:hypothetical protein
MATTVVSITGWLFCAQLPSRYSYVMLLQVRLITDVLPELLPGVQKEFPHRGVAFQVAATSVPRTSFRDDSGHGGRGQGGMRAHAEFDTKVFVLPVADAGAACDGEARVNTGNAGAADAQVLRAAPRAQRPAHFQAEAARALHSALQQQAPSGSLPADASLAAAPGSDCGSRTKEAGTEVAHLHTVADMRVSVGYEKATFADVELRYSVVSSRYNVTAANWANTASYVLDQTGNSLGLKGLYADFASHKVQAALQPENVVTRYLDSWYAVSADVRVNASAVGG